jgi:hypothetical protein
MDWPFQTIQPHRKTLASLPWHYNSMVSGSLHHGFNLGLFPVHSPLLGKSLLFSFPALSNMLKFSALSCIAEVEEGFLQRDCTRLSIVSLCLQSHNARTGGALALVDIFSRRSAGLSSTRQRRGPTDDAFQHRRMTDINNTLQCMARLN